MSSADILCKQPDQAYTDGICIPDFLISNFEKIQQTTKIKHAKFPSMQRLKPYHLFDFEVYEKAAVCNAVNYQERNTWRSRV